MNVLMAGKESVVITKQHATTSTTAQAQATGYVRGQISVTVMMDTLEMTAVLFLPAQMCLIAPKEGSVLTLMCASVRRIGLERTVPSSLVNHSTTAQNEDAAWLLISATAL